MKTLKTLAQTAAFAALFLTAGATMQAQGFGRNASDQFRIQHGVRDGRLNPVEAHRLERNEAFIRSERFRLMRDGYLSRSDRAYLASLERRQSFNIYRDAHDRF